MGWSASYLFVSAIAHGLLNEWYWMADPLQMASKWFAFVGVADYKNLVMVAKSIIRMQIIESV